MTNEGEGQIVTGTATDGAGNTTSASATINLDRTPPGVKAEVLPAANENGWHKEDATVRFSATDVLSGLEAVSPEQTIAAEGEEQPVEGTAIDRAGNTASASTSVSLDKTAPEISALSPTEGAVLDHARPSLSAAFTDALSGIDPSTARVLLDGAPARGELSATPEGLTFVSEADLPEGPHTVAVSVGDRAGNLVEKASGFEVDLGPPPGGPALRVVPSKLRVNDVGSTARLGAFLEENGARNDVSKDPATSYRSSAPSVVSVDAAGEMTFLAEGTAEVTATHGGLEATSLVEVDAGARPLIEGDIGPAGGEVVLPNGTGVDVPEGALSGRETIRIEEQPSPPAPLPEVDGRLVGPSYEFTPDGLDFLKPVELSMGYDPEEIPAGYTESATSTFWFEPKKARWVYLSVPPEQAGLEDAEEGVQQEIDMEAHVVTARTTHFTNFATGVPPNLPAPTPLRIEVPGNPDNGTELNVHQYPQAHNTAAPIAEHRNAAQNTDNIEYIVLHSTVSAYNQSLERMVYEERDNEDDGLFATYYVGRDGRIVQMFGDEYKASHVCVFSAANPNGCPNSQNGIQDINNTRSIGIEIVNASDGQNRTENYTGRQISAAVRLVDFLTRRYQLNPQAIVRPGGWNGTAYDRGNVVTHSEQRGQMANGTCQKYDPAGPFRSDRFCDHDGAMEVSPSLEEIVYQAVSEEHEGLVLAKGGDALGVGDAGRGGNVEFVYGDQSLEVPPANERNVANRRPSLVVPAGERVTFTGSTDLMHLIVEGTLNIPNDTNLDVDGVFYVGPNGTINAAGNDDFPDGSSLHIQADGFALVEGTIDTSGSDKKVLDGNGGSAGDFSFKTAAPGPAWVPTIVTRGGDADESLPAQPKAGGNGGNVTIQALENTAADQVNVEFRGSAAAPADTLPPPPPFTQMPIVNGGSFGLVRPAPADCRRPVSGERLPLGRLGGAPDGENISSFERGILTVGGIGGGHDDRTAPQAPGGNAGSITVANETQGKTRFTNVDFFAGAGAEKLCYQLFVPSLGTFERFAAPSGGLGAKGALNGGNGGGGGRAGEIFVGGANAPVDPARVPASEPVHGHNGANPNDRSLSYTNVEIGRKLRFSDAAGNTLLETSSVGGSGGSAGGGGGVARTGSFGAKGADAITTVAGQTFYP